MNVRLSVKTTRIATGHDVRRPREPEVVTLAEMAGSVASVLSPVAALSIAMLSWRLGVDMGFARNFCISQGLFSHWQTWMAVTFSIVSLCSRLKRYSVAADPARLAEVARPVAEPAPVAEPPKPQPEPLSGRRAAALRQVRPPEHRLVERRRRRSAPPPRGPSWSGPRPPGASQRPPRPARPRSAASSCPAPLRVSRGCRAGHPMPHPPSRQSPADPASRACAARPAVVPPPSTYKNYRETTVNWSYAGHSVVSAGPGCALRLRGRSPCSGVPAYTACDLALDVAARPGVELWAEFRAPDFKTYRLAAFPEGGHMVFRLLPNLAGNWTYRISGNVKEVEGKIDQFSVVSNPDEFRPIRRENGYHWSHGENLRPHLYAGADVSTPGRGRSPGGGQTHPSRGEGLGPARRRRRGVFTAAWTRWFPPSTPRVWWPT